MIGREKEMIELINGYLPRSAEQRNKLFEADAEIIGCRTGNFGLLGENLLFSIDEFSEEDLLRDEDPYVLGWNMALGTIGDILAVGGTPRYYGHSLVIRNSWSKEYVAELSRGIAAVLEKTETAFLGGDLGISPIWRYTGSVIGELKGEPLLRSGAEPGDVIYVTGLIGGGNADAALKMYGNSPLFKRLVPRWKNSFSLRCREAGLIKKYSRCCIDTSDGVFNALQTISQLSGTGFTVGDLPYVKSGVFLAKALSMPVELLFLGECGEYELLFTLSKEKEEAFITEAKEKELKFYRLGKITEPGRKLLRGKDIVFDLADYNLRARDYPGPREYLREVVHFLGEENQREQ